MDIFSFLCFLLAGFAVMESARIDKLEKAPKDEEQRRNVEMMLMDMGKGKGKSDDGHGNRLFRGKAKKDIDGNRITRISQEYYGLTVEGFEIVERVTVGKPVDEIDKATGKPTGRKLRAPRKREWNGKYVLDLEMDLGWIDKGNLKPSEALWKLKNEQGQGKSIKDEHTRSIVYVDEDTGKAEVAYKASFYGEGDGGPVNPVVVTDVDGNVLLEYDNIQHKSLLKQHDNIQHESIVQNGKGPGGNDKIGCYNYGSEKPLLKVKDLGAGRCQYDTGSVKVIDLNNAWNTDNDTPFEYDCFHQASDAINGACSPLNDAMHFGNKIYQMFIDWYKTPPLGSEPLVLKVHFGVNYQNAFWNGAFMTFGDGANVLHPLVSLDVTAHEIAHGVTDRSSDLIYKEQSGGLNEAFSDMAGKAAERYVHGFNASTFNWAIGSDIFKGSGRIRCMDNPTCDQRSIDHVSKYHSGMDVHHSSGIFNKVFYLLSNKFTFDLWDAFDLFFVANTKFWGKSTNFVDAAELTLKAMEEMKTGEHLPYTYSWINMQDIVDAFTEVGISCSKSGNDWNCTS